MTAPTAAERADALRRLADPGLDLADADALARFVLPHLNTATRWAKLTGLRLHADRAARLQSGLADPAVYSIRLPGETADAHRAREVAVAAVVLDALLDAAVGADAAAARLDGALYEPFSVAVPAQGGRR